MFSWHLNTILSLIIFKHFPNSAGNPDTCFCSSQKVKFLIRKGWNYPDEVPCLTSTNCRKCKPQNSDKQWAYLFSYNQLLVVMLEEWIAEIACRGCPFCFIQCLAKELWVNMLRIMVTIQPTSSGFYSPDCCIISYTSEFPTLETSAGYI